MEICRSRIHLSMKFSKFKNDERCKKLQRSLKLALLRRSGQTTSCGQGTPVSAYSLSSINVDSQYLNYSTSSLQISQMENEIVSSSRNLCDIMAKKRGRYTMHKPMTPSPSIQRSPMQKDRFDEKMGLSLSEPRRPKMDMQTYRRDLLPANASPEYPAKKSLLSASTSVRDKFATNENKGYQQLRSPTSVADVGKRQDRTFFNWRVMLNNEGRLLVKGTLESGKVARSKPIVKRLTTTRVQSIFEHTYHLEGCIVDNRGELPEYVRGKFYNGFPDDWENVYQLWVSFVSQGSKASFHWPTKITDSDDDINSEVTDLTILCTKEDESRPHRSDITLTAQRPSVSNVEVSSSNVRSNHWENRSPETRVKIANVTNSEIRIPASRDVFVSSAIKKDRDRNILDNKNQHGNVPLRNQNTIREIIQEDKVNIIVTNLMDKDCPQEYILKIIQMFDCLDDVFSYRIDRSQTSNEIRGKNDDKEQVNEAALVDLRSDCRNVPSINKRVDRLYNPYIGDTREIPSTILQKRLRDVSTESKENEDVQRRPVNRENIEECESETYAGIPKVAFQRILQNKRVPSKWEKDRHRRRTPTKTTEFNSMSKSRVNTERRSQYEKETRRFSSSDDEVTNNKEYFAHADERKGKGDKSVKRAEDIATKEKISSRVSALREESRDDSVRYGSTVNIKESEALRVEEKLDPGRVCDRGKRDILKYNRDNDISSTDEEEEVPQGKHKRRLSSYEIVKHSAKKPKIVNTNDNANRADRVDTPSGIDESGIERINNDETLTNEHVTRSRVTTRAQRGYDFRGNLENSHENVNFAVPNKFPPRKNGVPGSSSKIFYSSISKGGNVDDSGTCLAHRTNTSMPDKSDATYESPASFTLNSTARSDNEKTLRRTEERADFQDQFEATDEPKLLYAWVPRVIHDSKSSNELALVFEGKLLNEAGHVIHRKFVTECVCKRLSACLIETTNRQLYRLVGDLYDPNHVVVPKALLRYCRDGCPSDITKFCNIWKQVHEGDASETATKEEDATTIDIANVSTSLRGRKRFPPLSYWTGERVALKDDRVVYTSGSVKKLAGGLPCGDTANDRASFHERNESTTGKHLKNGETKEADDGDKTYLKKVHAVEKMHHRSEGPEGGEISRQNRSIDTLQDHSFVVPTSERRISRIDRVIGNTQRYDAKRRHKAGRDDEVDERRKQCNVAGQRSPVKKQNLMYAYYKDILRADDILSDDQLSQL